MRGFQDLFKKGAFFIVILMACWPAPTQAQEGLFLNPAVFYATRESELKMVGSTTKSTLSTTLLNATFGYSFGNGLLLGVKYIQDTETYELNIQQNPTVKTKMTAVGATLGFKTNGLCVQASTMALQPPKKETDTVTYSDGGGTNIDVMYLIDLGGWFLGPQLTWRSLEYKKMKSDNPVVDLNFEKLTETDLQPYISVFIHF